ncbi:UvrD-helicase domain-containing protein, partial [Methylacidimicrobium cyclopophantes]
MDRDLWLRIAFRLDSQWDHWLFDEFQDTSRAQWRALDLLIGEVIQSAEGSRTFFCVGDAKQSIYGWRGGDRKLFGEIASRYGEAIELRRLVTSHRSRRAVIDLVNAVFGNEAVLKELYGAAGAAWAKDWEPHRSAVTGEGGYACYLEARPVEGEGFPEESEEEIGADAEEEGSSPLDGALASLIRETIRPSERGLSCAVLVQTNAWARRLTDRLRKEGVGPVFLEGEIFPGADNQLGRLVTAALQSLAHPADMLARGWLEASPLGEPFRLEWERIGWRILHENGFHGVVEEILGRIPSSLGDAFAKERASLLREMAYRFDQTGSRDVERFLRFWKEQPVRLPEMTGTVQVMTIHKAKGLGFDVVVVTELERPLRRRGNLLRIEEDSGGAGGLLLAPGKAIVEKIPALAKAAEKAEEEERFERLCLLYVALTRARRELYLLAEASAKERGKSAGGPAAPTHRELLRRTLAEGPVRSLREGSGIDVLFERGERRKLEEPGSVPVEKESVPRPAEAFSFHPRSVRRMPVAPSRFEERERGQGVFTPLRSAGRKWGSLVHELLSRVERADAASLEPLRR